MGRVRRLLCCCFSTEGRKAEPIATVPVPAAPIAAAPAGPMSLTPVRSATLTDPVLPQDVEEEAAQAVEETVPAAETTEVLATSEMKGDETAQGNVSEEQLRRFTLAADQLIQTAAAGLLERGVCGVNPRDRSHLAGVGRELDEMCANGPEYGELVLTVAAAEACRDEGDAERETSMLQLAQERAFTFASRAFQQASEHLKLQEADAVPMPPAGTTESEPIPIETPLTPVPEDDAEELFEEAQEPSTVEETDSSVVVPAASVPEVLTAGLSMDDECQPKAAEMADEVVDDSASDPRSESAYFRGPDCADGAVCGCSCDHPHVTEERN